MLIAHRLPLDSAAGEPALTNRRKRTIMVASPQLLVDSGAAIGLPCSNTDRPLIINRSRPAMGTLFEACLVGAEEEHLSSVAEACLSEVQRIDRRLSRCHVQSETARINRE